MTLRAAYRLATALVLGTCLVPGVQAQQRQQTAATLFSEAKKSFLADRYSEAYGRFCALADSGDALSADIALFMYGYGPEVFGKDWDVSQEQLTAWASLNGRLAPVQRSRTYPATNR